MLFISINSDELKTNWKLVNDVMPWEITAHKHCGVYADGQGKLKAYTL